MIPGLILLTPEDKVDCFNLMLAVLKPRSQESSVLFFINGFSASLPLLARGGVPGLQGNKDMTEMRAVGINNSGILDQSIQEHVKASRLSSGT